MGHLQKPSRKCSLWAYPPGLLLLPTMHHFIKMLLKIATSPRTRWVCFTLFFGSMPIFMRWYTASIAEPCLNIPRILLSDLAVFGILFNASAMANLSAQKLRLDVFTVTMTLTFASSVFLSILFSISLTTTMSYSAWLTTMGLVLFSATLSFFTTNDGLMEFLQKEFDLANDLQELPSELREAILDIVCKQYDDRNMEEHKKLLRAVSQEVKLRRRGIREL